MIVVSTPIGMSPAVVTSAPGAAAQNNAPPRPEAQSAAQPVAPAVIPLTPVSSIANQSRPGDQGATPRSAKTFPASPP